MRKSAALGCVIACVAAVALASWAISVVARPSGQPVKGLRMPFDAFGRVGYTF